MLNLMLYMGFLLMGIAIGIYFGIGFVYDKNITMKKAHWIIEVLFVIGILMAVCAGYALGL